MYLDEKESIIKELKEKIEFLQNELKIAEWEKDRAQYEAFLALKKWIDMTLSMTKPAVSDDKNDTQGN